MRTSLKETFDALVARSEIKNTGYATPCLLWKGGTTEKGYPTIWFNGHWRGNRVSLIVNVGPPPEGKPFALHKCQQPQCINPDHLYWGTAKDNSTDTFRDNGSFLPKGSQKYNAKLTEDMVLEIRRLYSSGVGRYDLAKKYSVNYGTIHHIISGKAWKHI